MYLFIEGCIGQPRRAACIYPSKEIFRSINKFGIPFSRKIYSEGLHTSKFIAMYNSLHMFQHRTKTSWKC